MALCVWGGPMLALLVVAQAPTADTSVPLIARELLLGRPERTSPRLSPNGRELAWLGPDEKGVVQLWLKHLGGGAEAVVSAQKTRGVQAFAWTEDSSGLVFSRDDDGEGHAHVLLLELASKNVRDLTPWQSVRAALLATSPRFPDRVLVEANVRDRRVMDVWRIDLRTGAAELDTTNPQDVSKWLVDASFTVRAAVATRRDGLTEVRFRDSAKAPWRPLITAGLEESVDALGFTDDGKAMYVTTSIDSDLSRLVEKSLKTGAERELAKSPRSDVLAVLGHPVKKLLRAAAFDVGGRKTWTATDFNVKADLDALGRALGGDFSVDSMDAADSRWLVSETRDMGPLRYWLWERKARRLELLFPTRPRLEGVSLSPMASVVVKSRDGLSLSGYLTRPLGVAQAGPLVLSVHPGPWQRVQWGYDGETQLLANRGYSVLQVNFRGSTGFGKRLLNLGNREWGRAMQDDLVDAVQWAVQEGIADPKRVAIMGQSYGGYAALAALAFTPDVFACGVDQFGPSNLFTLLSSLAVSSSPFDVQAPRRVGDPDEPMDKELLKRASPLFSSDRIRSPLLIGHGANDPKVRSTELEQLVNAMEKGRAKVTYVSYPDEGPGFERAENRLDFYGRVEGFLAECLGGRAEPMPAGGRVAGSSAVVQVVGKR